MILEVNKKTKHTYRLSTNRLQHRSYHSIAQKFACQRVMNQFPNKSSTRHQIGMPFQYRNSIRMKVKWKIKTKIKPNNHFCKQKQFLFHFSFMCVRRACFFISK